MMTRPWILPIAFSLIPSIGMGQGSDCSNPTNLGSDTYLEFAFDGSNANTSGFSGMGACDPGGSMVTHDLFWTYTAPRTGTYIIDLYGNPGINRRLNVHDGADCLATCLATVTGSSFFAHTTLDIDLVLGQQILIQVGGVGAPLASSILAVTAQSDTCQDAVDLGNATFVKVVYHTNGTTDSGFGVGGPCALPSPNEDLFFQYTAPLTYGWYAFEVFGGSTSDPEVRLFAGTDCSAACLNPSTLPGRAFISLNAGDEVLVQVGQLGNGSEAGLLLVTAGLSDGCDLLSPDALEGPSGNNDCASATTIFEGSYANLNVGALDPDFYRLDLFPGQPLVITETQDTEGADWTLFDATCSTVLAEGLASLQYTAGTTQETVLLAVERPFQLGCSEYGFDVSLGTQIGPTFCHPQEPNCSGFPALLAGALSNGQGAGVHLDASFGPGGAFGYFLTSSGFNSPGTSIGNGLLCLGGSGAPIFRYNLAGDARNSIGAFSVDGSTFLNASGTGIGTPEEGFVIPHLLPAVNNAAITLGSTWHFQLWFRDDCPSPAASNFSNGLSVTF